MICYLKVADHVWREEWVKEQEKHYQFAWLGQSDTSKAKIEIS